LGFGNGTASKSTVAKYLICLGLVSTSFLHPYSGLHLLLVDVLGSPLHPILDRFPTLFFRDKPYYNF